jgi:outer membrane protein assembly factor BamB
VPRRALHRGLGAAAALVLFALSAAPAWAQAAASWPQFQDGSAHPGSLADGVAPPYRQAWRFDPGLTGRFGVSAPVLEGDLAVTVGPRAVYGVDLATGATSWQIARAYGPVIVPAIAPAGEGSALIYTEGYGPNPPSEAFSSPTASASGAPTPTATRTPVTTPGASEGGNVSFDSRVIAVDLQTREPLWDAPVDLRAVSRTGVTIDGDTAYVGDDEGIVTAIDTATGSVRWTYDAPGPVSTTVAAGEGVVVVSTQPRPAEPATVVAVHADDGSEAWRFQPTTLPFIATVPAIADGVVYLGFSDRTGSRARALSLKDGSELWATPVASQFTPFTAFVPTPDVVYAVDFYGQAHAFDLATGAPRWDFAVNAVVFRDVPVLSGSSLLVTTLRGSLVAIDTRSHELVARTAADGPQGYLGAMAVTPDLVIAVAGGHHPGLVAFEHDADTPLLAEPSPTVLVPGTMLGNFAITAVPLLLILALAGRWLLGRIGPAFADDGLDHLADDAGLEP